jgi:hypothetical protein
MHPCLLLLTAQLQLRESSSDRKSTLGWMQRVVLANIVCRGQQKLFCTAAAAAS